MATVAEYQQMLERATQANDAPAMDYFQSQIERGKQMLQSGSGVDGAGRTPAANGVGLPAPARGEPGAPSQEGNILDAALAGIPFSDELAGVGGGIASSLMGALGYGAPDESFSKGYKTITGDLRRRKAAYRERHPYVSMGTEIGTGLALPFAMFGRGLGGLTTAAGTGALYGAGEADPTPKRTIESLIDPDSAPEDPGLLDVLGQRAEGAAGGAVAGSLGHAALGGLSAIGRTVFPRAAPVSRMPNFRSQVQRLEQTGIPVTPAERISNPDARRAERIVSAYTGQGDAALQRPHTLHSRLMDMANFAPEDVNVGELSLDAVNRARQRFNTGYDTVLRAVPRLNLPAMVPEMRRIRAGFANLLPHEQHAGLNRVITDFEDMVTNNLPLSGIGYKRLRSGIARRAFEAQKSEANRYLAPVWRALRQSLDDSFRRAAPQHVSRQLRNLDRQYGAFKILERSADNPDAIGTMANLARRNRGRLNPAFHDLVTSYQDVLLRKGFPTSNTPEGLAASHILPPFMSALRSAGTRYGSAPLNDLRAQLPLPADMGNAADFAIGQQANPELARQLMQAMGLR